MRKEHVENLVLSSTRYIKQKEYWINNLSGNAGKTAILPVEEIETNPENQAGLAEIPINIPGDLSHRLLELSFQAELTVYIILLAGIKALLYRYTGNEDIIVLSPVYEPAVSGNTINDFLFVRDIIGDGASFKDLLIQIKQTVTDAYQNQDYPVEKLVEHLVNTSQITENFVSGGILCLLKNIHKDSIINDLKPGFAFSFTKEGHRIKGNLFYDAAVYTPHFSEQVSNHLVRLLEIAGNDVNIPIPGISFLSEPEKRRLVYDFNNNREDFPREKTICRFIEEHGKKTPGRHAIVFQDDVVTYRELSEKLNRTAQYLALEKQVGPGKYVGVLMDRSIDLAAAILGIWKAGGAYIPLDTTSPKERVKMIVNDAGIGVILSQKKFIRILNQLQWECESFHSFLCMDSTDVYSEKEAEENILMDETFRNLIVENADDVVTEGGWISSYTGEPLSLEIMNEFGDNFLKKLLPLLHENMRVLEIGIGSGFTLYRVAPGVGYYLGTDISKSCIEKNRERVEGLGYDNVDLLCVPAHDIDKIEDRGFDLIVMTSVVQSFQGHNYLRDVFKKMIGLLAENGHILVGDVLDLDSKDELIADLVRFKNENRDKNYTTLTDRSLELFLSRRFFEDLTAEFTGIADLEFSGKICKEENELTRFRYDVLVKIDKTAKETQKIRAKHKYQDDGRALEKYGGVSVDFPAASQPKPGDLAYVIYTSGSTGEPKGVLVEHIGMMNHIQAKINDLRVTGESIIAQNASQMFDISIWQFFAALTQGGKTIIYSNQLILEPMKFISRIIEDRVTILEVVPSYLSVMSEASWGWPVPPLPLDYLLVTGEEVKPGLVHQWFKSYPGIKMVNAYGPTEASDDITHFIMDKAPGGERIPIGKTLQNFNIYIVDKNMLLCPVGVIGEICVSGVGVGRGYLNDPGKTKAAFMEDPFREEKGVRLYKTGDLGRRLPDGIIEFYGRNDCQVKIRGYRIELGEIEIKLVRHSAVKAAVVVVRKDESGNNFLCAYLVMNEGLDLPGIKKHLMDSLPDYMVPAHFVELEALPLTPNGKIDRKALSESVLETTSIMPYITEEELKEVRVSPLNRYNENPGIEEIEGEGSILSMEEREKLLFTFNGTKRDFPGTMTLHRLVEEQVEKWGDRTALVYKDKVLTYRQLNRGADRLARVLRTRGIKANIPVGLLLDNSLEMIVGILGIMKSGGVFLPVDIEYPVDRKRLMLYESAAGVIVTRGSENSDMLNEYDIVDIENIDLYGPGGENSDHIDDPGDLGYIVFTSGSTGKPKGSAIVHRSFTNLVHWYVKEFGISADDSSLLATSISFDLTLKNIFAPLITGGKLYVYSLNYYDSDVMRGEIEQYLVTFINCTPSMVYPMVEEEKECHRLSSLRYVFFGGEAMAVAPLVKWIESGCFNAELVNTYGPSECTGVSAAYRIKDPGAFYERTVPIGKPVYNAGVFILDNGFRLLPVGALGEIYIAGEGVGNGYINDGRMTSEKFLILPGIGMDTRLYRTGDYGRWQPDGNIEFLGRIDHQVKIRGYRIELGEIENLLLKHAEIKESAVLVKEHPDGDKYMSAFVVGRSALSSSELREKLLKRLPLYMIPSYFVQLEKMPLNPNGKVDRKILAAVDVDTTTGYQAPGDEVEEKLTEIWAEILDMDKSTVSIIANFFELGGHSLKATIMAARIHKEFDTVVSLEEIFKTPTIKYIASLINIINWTGTKQENVEQNMEEVTL